ncbi:MAG: hypothetical protein ACJ797_27510 [Ktedonobacteraceae bacterium]
MSTRLLLSSCGSSLRRDRKRWMKDFEALKIEFKPEVRKKLLWRNDQKLLANTVVGHMHFS